jgi:plastocyanin
MARTTTDPTTRARARFPALKLLITFAGLALFAAACDDNGNDGSAAGTLPSDGERYFSVNLIEFPWDRNIDQTPYPDPPMDERFPEYDWSGDEGYILQEPDEDGNWRIGTYLFLPQNITITEGDQVTLELLGVRGETHDIFLDVPGEEQEMTVDRGFLEVMEFTAPEPGVYQLVCETHPPTMVMDIQVLASG